MHVLLEGVIPYELSLMLACFVVDEKYFTTDMLNDRIESFTYSAQEARDKPSTIKIQSLTSRSTSLSQSCEFEFPCCCCYRKSFYHIAAQMWILAINIPLLIGDKVPHGNQKWECFLVLLDILQFCTSRVTSSAQAGILEALVQEHHKLFIHCYPSSSITPKMHFMVHFPRQILRWVRFSY